MVDTSLEVVRWSHVERNFFGSVDTSVLCRGMTELWCFRPRQRSITFCNGASLSRETLPSLKRFKFEVSVARGSQVPAS